jgi:hypothetical protein
MYTSYIPDEIIYIICDQLSLKDLNHVKKTSKLFYKACSTKKQEMKNKFYDLLPTCNVASSNYIIKKDDEFYEIYSIYYNNIRYARIENELNLKIYNMCIFGSDDWFEILGCLLNHAKVKDVKSLNVYKSNIYVLISLGTFDNL